MSRVRHLASLWRQILLARAQGFGWKILAESSGIPVSTIRGVVARTQHAVAALPGFDVQAASDQDLDVLIYGTQSVGPLDIFIAQRRLDEHGKLRTLSALAGTEAMGRRSRSRLSEIRASVPQNFELPAHLRVPRPAGLIEICEDNPIYPLGDGRRMRIVVARCGASGAVAALPIDAPIEPARERGGAAAKQFLEALRELFILLRGLPLEIEFVWRLSPTVRHLLQGDGYHELEQFARHFDVRIPKRYPRKRREPMRKRSYRTMRDTDLPPSRGIKEFVAMHFGARLASGGQANARAFGEAVLQGVTSWNRLTVRALGVTHDELFERLTRPALRPLSRQPFVFKEVKRVHVQIDDHVAIGQARYSVPFSFRENWLATGRNRQRDRLITALISCTTVELKFGCSTITHQRRDSGYETIDEHMSSQVRPHLRDYASPAFVQIAERFVGRAFGAVLRQLISASRIPEQAYAAAARLSYYASADTAPGFAAMSDRLERLLTVKDLSPQTVENLLLEAGFKRPKRRKSSGRADEVKSRDIESSRTQDVATDIATHPDDGYPF